MNGADSGAGRHLRRGAPYLHDSRSAKSSLRRRRTSQCGGGSESWRSRFTTETRSHGERQKNLSADYADFADLKTKGREEGQVLNRNSCAFKSAKSASSADKLFWHSA